MQRYNLQLIVDEPFGSFQISDESLVPGGFFPDTEDSCWVIGRECITFMRVDHIHHQCE